MSIELRPLGVTCNIMCQYCYQNPLRDSHDLRKNYDMDAMLAALAADGEPFTLFGGEPLLVCVEDLERLWAYGFERFGRNRVQTNGTLIDEGHIELFRKYAVHVGISIDGPEKLNDARWAGSLSRTRAATGRAHDAIVRLCERGMAPSLIVTLHRGNGLPDHWGEMDDWLLRMQAIGVTTVRLHALEVDYASVGENWAMDEAQNAAAFLHFYDLERARLTTLGFDVFREVRELLLGDDGATGCVWHACDPYTTPAVHGVEGFGERSNCGRTNKRGIDFIKTDMPGFERSLTLWQTPQSDGGCRDCRFFAMCKGQCPGTSIDGDWRNRSAHCSLWTALFERIESDLLNDGQMPLSLHPRRALLEERLVQAMVDGHAPLLADLLGALETERPESHPGATA